jgi:ubiquitin carboxyl-terminal hydrolase 10
MSYLFGGKTRCVIKSQGRDSIVVEPFQALQLDISPDSISTISQALAHHSHPESFTREVIDAEGRRREVQAERQYLIEGFPRVLILHLKRFLYDGRIVQKVSKEVEFDEQLKFEPGMFIVGKINAEQNGWPTSFHRRRIHCSA